MVWPILISVSVIPGALSARAEPALAASAAAAALDCRNERRVIMAILPFLHTCRRYLRRRRFQLQFVETERARAKRRSPPPAPRPLLPSASRPLPESAASRKSPPAAPWRSRRN